MKLNVQNCEIVQFGRATPSPHQESVNSHIPTKAAAKCLGYWWSRDLLSNRSVEENIKEGSLEDVFFKYGALGSQGDINPHSTKSVIDTCASLLYDCDNWILTEKSVQLLESFLGRMAKRAL